MLCRCLLIVTLGAFAWAPLHPPAKAQTNAGTSVGQFLLIEPSARSAAMGNAGGALSGEVLAAYYNPAALGTLGGSDAQFTHAPWIADVTYDHAAVALGLGRSGSLMASVTALNSGDIAVRTIEQPLGTGEQYRASDLAFALAYGRRITERFAAGAQAAYVRQTIWRSSLTALALGFGVQYEITDGGPVLGASVSNLGTRGRFDGIDLSTRIDPDPDVAGNNSALPGRLQTDAFSLPTLFRVGVAWPVRLAPDHRVLVAVDAFQPSDNTESVSVGGEWAFRDLLAVRAGYQNLFQDAAEGGLSLGGGLRYRVAGAGLRVDYAWTDFGRVGSAQRFTLGVSF